MRKIGESIIINDKIEVQVVEVKGRSVKLGFVFPPTETVLRKEIHDRIVEENVAAQASTDMSDLDLKDAIAKLNLGTGSAEEAKKDEASEPKKTSD